MAFLNTKSQVLVLGNLNSPTKLKLGLADSNERVITRRIARERVTPRLCTLKGCFRTNSDTDGWHAVCQCQEGELASTQTTDRD